MFLGVAFRDTARLAARSFIFRRDPAPWEGVNESAMERRRLGKALCLLALGIWIASCSAKTIPGSPSASTPSRTAPTPQPGLIIRGTVRTESGHGLADVKIFLALASYAGKIVAVTDPNGDYQCEAIFIPGEEMIRVWAELPGYILHPDEGSSKQKEFFWRHYYGLEDRVLNFNAQPDPGRRNTITSASAAGLSVSNRHLNRKNAF